MLSCAGAGTARNLKAIGDIEHRRGLRKRLSERDGRIKDLIFGTWRSFGNIKYVISGLNWQFMVNPEALPPVVSEPLW